MSYLSIGRFERIRRLTREGFWVVLGQGMAILGALLGVRLLTELLKPSEYGELALGMTIATLLNQTILGPLGNGVTRFYAPAQERKEIARYLHAVRELVLAATAIIALGIMLVVAGLAIADRREWISVATVALVFATINGYNSILNGIQNAARHRAIVALHQGAEPWVRFLVATGMILWLGASSTMALTGYTIGILLVLASQYVHFRKIISSAVSARENGKEWRTRIWNYSWPFASWGIFTWAQIASDRWALQLVAPLDEVGFYAVLFQLGYYPITIATGMIVQLLMPVFYQRAGDANDSRRNADVNVLSWRSTILTLATTITAFLIALHLHTQIFGILAAKEYAPVSHLLPWVLLSGGIFAAGQMIALNLMSQMKTRSMSTAKIVTGLLGVIFNFVGAYFYGITGIVVAGLLFSFSYFLWMMVLLRSDNAGRIFS